MQAMELIYDGHSDPVHDNRMIIGLLDDKYYYGDKWYFNTLPFLVLVARDFGRLSLFATRRHIRICHKMRKYNLTSLISNCEFIGAIFCSGHLHVFYIQFPGGSLCYNSYHEGYRFELPKKMAAAAKDPLLMLLKIRSIDMLNVDFGRDMMGPSKSRGIKYRQAYTDIIIVNN